MNTSFHNFNYALDFIADFTPPQLAVTAGGPARAFVPRDRRRVAWGRLRLDV
jgi:hypothetical protein